MVQLSTGVFGAWIESAFGALEHWRVRFGAALVRELGMRSTLVALQVRYYCVLLGSTAPRHMWTCRYGGVLLVYLEIPICVFPSVC
jgi:hypothetical protein